MCECERVLAAMLAEAERDLQPLLASLDADTSLERLLAELAGDTSIEQLLAEACAPEAETTRNHEKPRTKSAKKRKKAQFNPTHLDIV